MGCSFYTEQMSDGGDVVSSERRVGVSIPLMRRSFCVRGTVLRPWNYRQSHGSVQPPLPSFQLPHHLSRHPTQISLSTNMQFRA